MSPKSSDYFEPAKKGIDTRSDQLLVKENLTNTRRCQNAPHNYQTNQPKQDQDSEVQVMIIILLVNCGHSIQETPDSIYAATSILKPSSNNLL